MDEPRRLIVPDTAAEAADLEGVNERVARHIQVTDGETPSVATVQDADRFQYGQSGVLPLCFQNGDRLLVYSDKAVLYSTSQDKLRGDAGGRPAAGCESRTGCGAVAA